MNVVIEILATLKKMAVAGPALGFVLDDDEEEMKGFDLFDCRPSKAVREILATAKGITVAGPALGVLTVDGDWSAFSGG